MNKEQYNNIEITKIIVGITRIRKLGNGKRTRKRVEEKRILL